MSELIGEGGRNSKIEYQEINSKFVRKTNEFTVGYMDSMESIGRYCRNIQ